MNESPLIRVLIVSGLLFLALGCSRVDPLTFVNNSKGEEMVDAVAGGNSRVVCISAETVACTKDNANIQIDGIDNLDAVLARWRNDEVVEVFFADGDLARCIDSAIEGRVTVEVRRVSMDYINLIEGNEEGVVNKARSLPDLCGGH
jgi:hypothetical protein